MIRRILRVAGLIPFLLFGSYYSSSLTITTSGTPVPLSNAVPALPANCLSVGVFWNANNSGTAIYLGGSNVSAATKLGAVISSSFPSAYFAPTSNPTNILATIYADAATSGDKVTVTCTR